MRIARVCLAAAVTACASATDVSKVPVDVTITVQRLEQPAVPAVVDVTGGDRSVLVVGNFHASCSFGPSPTASAVTTAAGEMVVTVSGDADVACIEGSQPLRYTVTVPNLTAGNY